jgi:hypothetical protein
LVSLLSSPDWRAFAFLPVTLVTAAIGLAIERRRGEGSPLDSLDMLWEGWSRPLYWLLALDLLAVQIEAVSSPGPGCLVGLTHALLLIGLAVIWAHPILPYVSTALGWLATLQFLAWIGVPPTATPVGMALLALGYGLIGYGLDYARSSEGRTSPWSILERPLEQSGLAISLLAIVEMLVQGRRIMGWVLRSLLFGNPMMTPGDTAIVHMAAAVLALTGLLYLAAALVRRWSWRGYGSIALLLCAWSLELFLVWGQREVQWYAILAGIYLLIVGYLEWRQDRKQLALWIDRAALLLLLGSSFLQSLFKSHGWPYALLMGAESLFLMWWGSARRQRRFLYLGVLGVVTAPGGQLARQLFSANAFIAFGVPGLIIMALVILIERNLERIKRVSPELWKQLEDWD